MLISNRTFAGERPKRDERNLNPDEARVALDCELVSTTLRSLKAPAVEEDNISPTTQSIFFFNGSWFTFDDDLDIIELSDRLFWTGPEGTRQATFAQLQSNQSYAAGVPKPDSTPTVVVSGTGEGVPFDTFYFSVFVNQFGEPGDFGEITEITLVERGQTVQLNNIGISNQSDPSIYIDAGVTHQRIYRLAEGEARFVAEVPATDTSFTEVIGEITLAEVFPSEDFFPPPPNMDGLHLMANGIALGFVAGERQVYVSEPFNANAWPYFFPTEGVPCAISSYDNNAVIITDGYPEVAAINDPRNIVPTTLTYREPCTSPRSVVQAEGGVIYASTNGLFYIGRGGGRRITKDHIDHHSWQDYAPETMIALYRDQQYIGFHRGVKEGNAMVFDMRMGESVLRQLSQRADAVFVRPGTDQGYVASDGQILELEGGEDRLTYTYTSKYYGQGSPFALTSRRVISCEQVDRAYSIEAEADLTELFAERAAALAARSGLNDVFGFGGAINQHLIAGHSELIPPSLVGGPNDVRTYRTINGVAAPDIFRVEVLSVNFKLYGDKELVHDEIIYDDEAINRLTYFDRRRLYDYDLIGNLDISQIDIAGSNTAMHTGT